MTEPDAMTRDIAKYIFEVRDGVFLLYGERTELEDGWWFTTNDDPIGPFDSSQEALDAARAASDASAKVRIVPNPDPPLPVVGPGESPRRKPVATGDIRYDAKYVFEVRDGVMLAYGERTELADGWWFSTNGPSIGPFATEQEALDAADAASDPSAKLGILQSPNPPLPVTEPGERFPLWSSETGKLVGIPDDDSDR